MTVGSNANGQVTAKARIETLRRHLRAPLDPKKKVRIHVARNLAEAERYCSKGWCPIECSAGSKSIVDDLQLDHHGELSHLDGVALRAYDLHYGARVADPRIVFIGFPDEDACFAAAAVTAQLPHPILGDVFSGLGESQYRVLTQNLGHLAALINRVDIDKNAGKELDDTEMGRLMILWRQLAHPTLSNETAWWGGISRWVNYTTKDLRLAQPAAVQLQHQQMEKVLSAEHVLYGRAKQVAVADFSALGRNSVFYDHWNLHRTPVLVAYFSDLGVCSIVVHSMDWAKAHIGPRGLMHIYDMLKPRGAGGREVLGGSSRFDHLSWEGAKALGEQLAGLLDKVAEGELHFH